MSWIDDAACAGVDVAVFFPKLADGYNPRAMWNEARRLCAGCTVRSECLTDAMRYEERTHHRREGFVGGMSPRERNELAAKRGAA